MTQTAALLIDSFRMITARKLFWITLAISLIIVLVYASLGSNERGMSMLFGLYTFEDATLADNSPFYRALMLHIFSIFIVPIWLAWGATILALVSTTSAFPDFLSDGAIDLVLSKPIHRAKIFFVKYLGSLLFVLLQVGVFCIGVFLTIGLRLGEWNWTILAAVPIVLIFFSYLYCVNVLVGVVTRSAIAALLVTMLFWFLLFLIQFTEGSLNQFRMLTQLDIERTELRIERNEQRLERANTPANMREAVGAAFVNRERIEAQIERDRQEIATKTRTLESMERWRRVARHTLTVLPKNQETIRLLDRWIRLGSEATMDDWSDVRGAAPPPQAPPNAQPPQPVEPRIPPALPNDQPRDPEAEPQPRPEPPPELDADIAEAPPRPAFADPQMARDAERRVRADYDQRSPWFIIGTSLGFEAIVLLLACWWFIRRDF